MCLAILIMKRAAKKPKKSFPKQTSSRKKKNNSTKEVESNIDSKDVTDPKLFPAVCNFKDINENRPIHS